jgi:hypothetical protein
MNERLPKLNPPLEQLVPIPPPGTVTGVSSGAAALVPIEWLRELNTMGVRPGDLSILLDELEDQAEAEDMVSAWPDDTGLPNAIKIIPGNPAHGPRIKVALNPSNRFTGTGDWAWILFGEAPGAFDPPRPGRSDGPLPSAALLRQLHDFIERNRAALFAFDRDPDQGGISGAQLVKSLRKID